VYGASTSRLCGELQREPIVAYGPFVAHTREDLARLFDEYRAGRFPPLARA
jgi:redox-sensitive bicupin YhaK (pirin superfamily)